MSMMQGDGHLHEPRHTQKQIEYTIDPPMDSGDAMRWAESFVSYVEAYGPKIPLDAGTMVGWFANAMAASDRAMEALRKETAGTLLADVTAHDLEIEIQRDGKVVWIHADGITLLRACRIDGSVIVIDKRGDS